MCVMIRDVYGRTEGRYVCQEGALGECDRCGDVALVRDDDGARCALHILPA